MPAPVFTPEQAATAFASLPRAWPLTGVSAVLRAAPEDFVVEEIADFEPDGDGRHVLLLLQKRNTNTAWLAERLAELAGVELAAIGYGGLKDRRAVTTQWFSIDIGNHPEPDWVELQDEDIQILEVTRHGQKLQRGFHRANRFVLRLTGIEGDLEALEPRLQQVREQGVPNYFAEQRFGRDGNNLVMADRLFAGESGQVSRHQKSLYLSAARSWLFNRCLAKRVEAANWNTIIRGDVFCYDGSPDAFQLFALNPDMQQRFENGGLHATGMLYGTGMSMARADMAAIETQVADEFPDWCRGLEKAGLKQGRRALRVVPRDMSWKLTADVLELSFELVPGAYATAVLRELLEYRDGSQKE